MSDDSVCDDIGSREDIALCRSLIATLTSKGDEHPLGKNFNAFISVAVLGSTPYNKRRAMVEAVSKDITKNYKDLLGKYNEIQKDFKEYIRPNLELIQDLESRKLYMAQMRVPRTEIATVEAMIKQVKEQTIPILQNSTSVAKQIIGNVQFLVKGGCFEGGRKKKRAAKKSSKPKAKKVGKKKTASKKKRGGCGCGTALMGGCACGITAGNLNKQSGGLSSSSKRLESDIKHMVLEI